MQVSSCAPLIVFLGCHELLFLVSLAFPLTSLATASLFASAGPIAVFVSVAILAQVKLVALSKFSPCVCVCVCVSVSVSVCVCVSGSFRRLLGSASPPRGAAASPPP